MTSLSESTIFRMYARKNEDIPTYVVYVNKFRPSVTFEHSEAFIMPITKTRLRKEMGILLPLVKGIRATFERLSWLTVSLPPVTMSK